jgi:hypothetical protein
MPDNTPAAPAAPDVFSMTAEEASATLAAMDAALHPPPPLKPADAQDASARLDKLTADKSFADRLLGGDVAAKKEFEKLIAAAAAGDDVGDRLANIQEPTPLFETTSSQGGQMNRRDLASIVDTFRDSGIADPAIEQALNGVEVTHQEYAAAKALQSARHGDEGWRARFLKGNWAEVREQLLLNVILTSAIKQE